MIRPAQPADTAMVAALVDAAYGRYIAPIGKKPGPMLDDYAALIAAGRVSVVPEPDGGIAAIVVLLPRPDHLLLDNIAVRPDRQGTGLGGMLVEFAEREAQRLGYGEVRLYTHQAMTENIALYRHLGFHETGRGEQGGYSRMFMAKRLDRCT